MNISENISYILKSANQWEFYTNRSYTAKIQKADKNRIYNVEGKAGIVYNFFEDAYESVCNGGYIVTGIAGEMYPIGEQALKKYNIYPPNITFEPVEVNTVETDTVFAGILIPLEIQFTLETDYGEKALLKDNRPEIEHGDGDYVLVSAKLEGDKYVPDFSDSGRIINGTVFAKLYKKKMI